MSRAEALLEVGNLRTWIEGDGGVVRAVDGVSLRIGRGETFALLGESGCGKSMTALSIMRLLPERGHIVGGEVRLGDTDLLALPELAMRRVRGGRIGMIFQEPGLALNPVMTIGEQIDEVLAVHTALRGEAAARRAVELLERVGIPDPGRRLAEYPFQYSGGMKQRAMIAMALAGEPELLVADEPTTALDVTIQAQVLELMRALQRDTGMGMLLITHDLGVVQETAHRVGVMYAGQLVEAASREDLFARPLHPYTVKLFAALPARGRRGVGLEVIPGSVPPLTGEFRGCRFAERCEFAWERCRAESPAWHEPAEGRGVRCHLFDGSGQSPMADRGSRTAQIEAIPPSVIPCSVPLAPLLQVSDLRVHFPIRRGLFKRVVGQVKAVDGLSLEIRGGRTLALVGESGCGKTTAGKGILRLVEPTSGSVRFAGEELTTLSRAALRERRREFQIVFQDPYSSLNPRMRITEIIEEGMSALGIEGGSAERQRRVDELLGQVGLPAEAKWRYPHEFSGGQRQRIAIARVLAVNPKLIVFDEPTSALDVSVQAQILNLIGDLQRRLGIGYLFITHNLGVVDYLADEVAVMYLGRIVERGAAGAVLGDPRHPYTRALLSAVPVVDPATQRDVIRLQGELPSPASPPVGCHFHPRCPQAMPACREGYPEPTRLGADRSVACHLYSN
ncbi:MAG TPA: ABC transporter ATP-binding protein [Burkholderiales bacterium]|nr:ABC transporter ATP-binding protein [Burkholderiales bacterium]